MPEDIKRTEKVKENITYKIWNTICRNTPQIALIIPIIGFLATAILNVWSYILARGYYECYAISQENMIINNTYNIYRCILLGIVTLFCISYSILAIRRILRKRVNILYWGVIFNYIQGVIFYIYVAKEINLYVFIVALFLIPIQGIMIFAIGYCFARPLQLDIIQDKKKASKKKKVIKEKQVWSSDWGDKDYIILGIVLIIVGVIFFGVSAYTQGNNLARRKDDYAIVCIEDTSYAVIGADKDKMVLQECKLKSNNLVIYTDTYLNVDKSGLVEDYYDFNTIYREKKNKCN